jgi:hypothetical protein
MSKIEKRSNVKWINICAKKLKPQQGKMLIAVEKAKREKSRIYVPWMGKKL